MVPMLALLTAGAVGSIVLESNVASCASRSLIDGGMCFETHLNLPFMDLVSKACALQWGVGCLRRGYAAEIPEWTNGTSIGDTFDVSAFRLAVDANGVPNSTAPASDTAGSGLATFVQEGLRMKALPRSSASLAAYARQLEARTMAASTEAKTGTNCTTTVIGCAWAGSIGIAVGDACDCPAQKLAYQLAKAVHDAANPPAGADPEDACTVTVIGCAWAGAIGVDIGGACDCGAAQKEAYTAAKALHDVANPTPAPAHASAVADASRVARVLRRALAARGV
jgi:hypothetical protein